MELFDLSGKTAIITGSSRGIGKAIAFRLAEHGAKVVISSRKAEACDAVAAEINERFAPGGSPVALSIAANIAVKDELHHLVDQARAVFGPIDILVCNAASNPYAGPMKGMTDEQFTKIFQNNVLSNHWLIQMVAPDMLAKGAGSIIVISSIGGMRGNGLIGAYNISKAADMQLVRNMAVEFGPYGVRVNSIAPGLVQTDFARYLWENPELLRQVTEPSPLRRIGQPDEIAGAAVFLASGASTFLTGQTLVVDGGLTIAW